ncbi:hypothetical protein KB20921_30920 [Edwardsiella ictaluri]|nr:hypothetical protein KH20906_30820 [Edwardsiella ictaluri]BEI03831.1 hypothetical protein KB20921_30920 [Edwardsiella ictaluri]BEI07287.1 hypothetical protein KH201010_30730 [Edwardsiella ictaluri]BEI10759.1 hypothetical protein STU22726_30900 [Edwardsiella ictaluri]BEI14238.1 hypothetical protein STU22816_30910 [Edwardsiella ictaluri]
MALRQPSGTQRPVYAREARRHDDACHPLSYRPHRLRGGWRTGAYCAVDFPGRDTLPSVGRRAVSRQIKQKNETQLA